MISVTRILPVLAIGLLLLSPLGAQEAKAKTSTAEQQAMMEAWQKASTPSSNHKLLAGFKGNWNYTGKLWMEPGAPPQTTSGSATTVALLDGRYFQEDSSGSFMGMPFHGIAVMGYDNVAQHFTSTWIDNMSTSILFMTGSYDLASKTFTYLCEMDDMLKPGSKVKVRQVVKVLSDDSHILEWYEVRGGKERKTMEMTYTRQR